MKIRRMICVLLAVVIAASALSGCGSRKFKSAISGQLSIDCTSAEITEKYDSHGRFLGDGTSYYRLEFSDGSQVAKISESDKWSPLPLPESLQAVAWGLQDDEYDFAPMIIRDNDWDSPLIPRVENGYYYFFDRHSDATDPKDYSMLLDESRPSYNFTLAIYDTEANILYFSEVDT